MLSARTNKHRDLLFLKSLRASAENCTCQAARQTARTITQMYDGFLEPVDSSIGQYLILARLHRSKAVSMANLASKLHMDRTSLTRTLRPLEREGLLTVRSSSEDGRCRMVRLTATGLDRIALAYPLWSRAQMALERSLRTVALKQVRALLSEVSDIAGHYSGVLRRRKQRRTRVEQFQK